MSAEAWADAYRATAASLGDRPLTAHLDRASPAIIKAWIEEARPRDRLAYFRGELARAARSDPELAEAARTLLSEAPVVTHRMSGCRHWRGNATGTGRLELVQYRVGPGEFAYVARRRPDPS